MSIEDDYQRFLKITNDPAAASTLVLAEVIEGKSDRIAMTAKEAAKALGMSRTTIYKLCDEGRLRHTKVARMVPINTDDLLEVKAEKTKGGPVKFKHLKLEATSSSPSTLW